MTMQTQDRLRAVTTRPTALDRLRPGGSARRVVSMDTLPATQTSIFPKMQRNVRFAAILFVILGIGVAVLLTQVAISGAVITSGILSIEGGPKVVQHPRGGIITAIDVKEGDQVTEGEVLITLDKTVAQAQVTAAATALAQQEARLARLVAERDGLKQVDFSFITRPTDLSDAEFAAILASEQQQFVLRREQRDGERQQLAEQEAQLEKQIEGRNAQLAALRNERALVEKQLGDMQKLLDQQLVPAQRVVDLQRSLSQMQGQEGVLVSANAETAGKISGVKVAILQVDQNLRSDLTDQLSAAQSAIAQYQAQLATGREQLEQTTVRAPQSGTVLGLAVHTVGGVAPPGQTLMTIVPSADTLVGEVRVSPADIDQLYPGQPATLNFSAFDRGTTPTLLGHVKTISADLVQDSRTGARYYSATVEAEPDEMAKLKNLKLVPGMPIEVFIQTEKRTIASYLTKPLADQINRAFR